MQIRRQFGHVIGSFQVLQHRAVDLYLELSLMRASMESAAALYDSEAPPLQKLAAVSRAKARASRGALMICRQAIQIHGANGYTDEADIGLFLRKTMTLVNLLGSERFHRARFLELMTSGIERPDDRRSSTGKSENDYPPNAA
jgi:alkylation response protein AidB-like acyl-CoA dehydrogenase